MRSTTTIALLAAATAAAAQTTQISFFYPEDEYDEELDRMALSVIEVQDASHTVVAISCASTSSAAAAATSTSDNDDDYYDTYEDSCVFAGSALTATVGPDSFQYTTAWAYDSYGSGSADAYDLTMAVSCTKGADAALCEFSSGGAAAYSQYCEYSATLDSYDDDAVTACIASASSAFPTLPASTSALQADEVGTVTMAVTAGADGLSAGAGATASPSATASQTSVRSKFTVSASATAVVGGATTTIGGPSSSGAGASGSGSASAAQATGAAARKGVAAVGVVGGVVAALAAAL